MLASCPIESRPDGAPRLTGKLRIRIKRDSRAYEAYEIARAEESFNCNYELNPEYRAILERNRLLVSGVSPDGGARIVELAPNWFVGTGFLPQISSESGKPHPLIVAFLKAGLALKKLKNHGAERPETLESRWDILYRDYPEVYDEFAAVMEKGKRWVDVARKLVSLKSKTVADIASGSGISSFELAEYAEQVIGIEPEDAMREVASKNAEALGVENVSFKKGWAQKIPLDNASVGLTVCVGGAFYHDAGGVAAFIREAERITKNGGHILLVNTDPTWYGGELAPVILGKNRGYGRLTTMLDAFGFKHRDYYSVADFGTVDRAIKTYGFIFGRNAIEYIRKHQKSAIKFRWRIHYKQIS